MEASWYENQIDRTKQIRREEGRAKKDQRVFQETSSKVPVVDSCRRWLKCRQSSLSSATTDSGE